MITESNLKDALLSLGFHGNGDAYEKYFPDFGASMGADFAKKKLYYPDAVEGRERNDSFSAPENFVVFECVCRLLGKGYRPEHIELLINMNSFGFIREGCRVMGQQFKMDDDSFFDDLVEYDPTKLDASDKSVEALNQIAGGDYWKSIIKQYASGQIDGYKAEEYFSEQYCQRLSESYTYVLNMPIRIHQNQHPKYRMIHATNHPDGCVLMADNICNRWELLKEIQTGSQLSFFQEDINNQIIDASKIRDQVVDHFSGCDVWTSLTEAEAVFFAKHGAICKSGEIAKVLKSLEKEGRLLVDRNPAFSEKTKKPTSFMTEGHGKTVSVKWVR